MANQWGTLALLGGLLACPSIAQALPAGFIEQEIPGPWSGAAGLEWGPDGLLYVVERGGKVHIVENGVKQPTPFIDLSSEVGGWRDYGLLGFALHPNFSQNHYVYLFYVVDHYDLRMCNAARDNANCQPPAYNAATDEYFQPTIGRITRYQANPATNYRTVLPASRTVLVGETIGTGFPILHQSHGTGHLVFGEDGTLMATCGDAASYNVVDTGSNNDTYFQQALNEGILRPDENIGALRAQYLGSLGGKMIRIDPMTGDGLPSNPFFDAANPRSPASRTWALGLRNPYRFTRKPGTGSHHAEDGDPGVFYLGDVGWGSAEDLHVISRPGQNLGWPHFEGMTTHAQYSAANIANRLAKNPLFGVNGCAQEYLYFRNLIVQEKQSGIGSWPNPCDVSVQIPDTFTDGTGQVWTYHKFMHSRPPIDWRGSARAATFDANGNATTTLVGAAGSPVLGSQFSGNASTGGVWYTGQDFPAQWRNTYFAADYGGGWIKSFVFDAQHRPSLVQNFVDPGNAVVFVSTHPTQGGLYYVKWGDRVRRVSYSPANRPPVAAATPAVSFGPGPLTVQFGNQSSDPDNQPLTHLWDFGDGTTSTAVAPSHVFAGGGAGPREYTVRLTVTDSAGAAADTTLVVSTDNTPPTGRIVSPREGQEYPTDAESEVQAVAAVADAEQAEPHCTWDVEVHHNDHVHGEPPVEGCSVPIHISPIGCGEDTFFFRLRLTVRDDAGLSVTDVVDYHPDCANDAPRVANDTAEVGRGRSVAIDLLQNDWDVDGILDGSTVAVVQQPAYGFVNIDPLTGLATYTHGGSTQAADSLTYVVADDDGAVSAEATVLLNADIFPLVEIIAPQANGVVDAQRFTLRWTQDLPGGGPVAEILVDGQAVHAEPSGVGEHAALLQTPAPGAHVALVSLTQGDGQPDAFSTGTVHFTVVKGPTWDSDGDLVPDVGDAAPEDRFACRDSDADSCDDCSSGADAPDADGVDGDGDGLCDEGDFNGCDGGGCSVHADCTPTPGGRVCTCLPGYLGDGVACVAVGLTADAGPDLGTCDTTVVLVGSGGAAGGQPVTHAWHEGDVLLGQTATLTLTPGPGEHLYTFSTCLAGHGCVSDTKRVVAGPQGAWPDATAYTPASAHNKLWCEGFDAVDRCGLAALESQRGVPAPVELSLANVAQLRPLVVNAAVYPTVGVRVYGAGGVATDYVLYNAAAKGATLQKWAPSSGSVLTDMAAHLARYGHPAHARFALLAGGAVVGELRAVATPEPGELMLYTPVAAGGAGADLVLLVQAPTAQRLPTCPPGTNVIIGTDLNDTLAGTNGPDCIIGLAGTDVLDGLGGDDVVFGGRGNDTLYGHAGRDTLDGGSCSDKLYGAHVDAAVVDGDADLLSGGVGTDTLYGGEGDDTLDGGDGIDTVYGGPGADRLLGGAGNDRLRGEDGNDTALGGAGADLLYGGGADDTLSGGDGDDKLYGEAGLDILDGDVGADTLDGGPDADTLSGGDGADKLYGRAGADILWGGADADLLYGGTENDQLAGNEGADTMYGEDGNDTLRGDAGDDLLRGGRHDDYLDGGADRDSLTGESGKDTCVAGEVLLTCEL
jgi:Ca2+-binding RTX toxin-like protein/glucose/arabinose dehydrogenase